MIGYISLVNDSGDRAYMRVDEIAAFRENKTKIEKGGDLVPCVTVTMRNNVSWHFPNITPQELRQLMGSATGNLVQVTDETALGR